MGASCAKSYQAQQYTKMNCENIQQQNQQYSIVLIINENLQTPSRGSAIDKENSIEYRYQFNDFDSEMKFTPKIGFEQSNKSSGLRKDQFSFKNYKTDAHDSIFEVCASAQKNEPLWKRVSSTGSHISINDNVKLGGNTMRLKYFMNQDQIRAMKQGNEEIEIKKAGLEGNVCRLCKNLQKQKESPFILPCKCAHSVHQNCFSRQIFDQSVTLDDFKMAFRFVVKKTECQVCHESLETYIWKRFLANLTIHEGYYAIFERKVSSDINMIEHTQFFVIRFVLEHQQIKLGRSKTCDCSIPQDDIEKVHAFLKVKDGLLYIFDDGSKSGTFIEHHGNRLEIGQEYCINKFSFTTKKRYCKQSKSSMKQSQQIRNVQIRA